MKTAAPFVVYVPSLPVSAYLVPLISAGLRGEPLATPEPDPQPEPAGRVLKQALAAWLAGQPARDQEALRRATTPRSEFEATHNQAEQPQEKDHA